MWWFVYVRNQEWFYAFFLLYIVNILGFRNEHFLVVLIIIMLFFRGIIFTKFFVKIVGCVNCASKIPNLLSRIRNFFLKKRKIYAHVTHIFYMYIWMEILISPKNLYLLFLLNLYINKQVGFVSYIENGQPFIMYII